MRGWGCVHIQYVYVCGHTPWKPMAHPGTVHAAMKRTGTRSPLQSPKKPFISSTVRQRQGRTRDASAVTVRGPLALWEHTPPDWGVTLMDVHGPPWVPGDHSHITAEKNPNSFTLFLNHFYSR